MVLPSTSDVGVGALAVASRTLRLVMTSDPRYQSSRGARPVSR